MANKVRQIRGRISYKHGTHETGREFFSLSIFPDGSRTVRCECHFDADDLIRDSVFTLDSEWRPVDAYLRVARSNEFLGAGWYRFSETTTLCDTIDAEQGSSHRLVHESKTWPPACGFHPILNDGLWTALFDLKYPQTVQTFVGCITHSTQQIGRSGIAIQSFDINLRYLGLASVTVAAGTFDCRHFEAHILGLASPFELWTFSDDYIVVKETWSEMPGQTFELQSLIL